MMALGDILAARADNARARGTVEAGTLGTVTVEALPVRELERLMRGADGDRAVFYAACRELQGAGAALLRAGKVYRPDQVMALVSDAEAAKAAEAVRALSASWNGSCAAARRRGRTSPRRMRTARARAKPRTRALPPRHRTGQPVKPRRTARTRTKRRRSLP